MITRYRFPCVRCNRVHYLEVESGLCVTLPPKLLAEITTCYEWYRHWMEASMVTEEAA